MSEQSTRLRFDAAEGKYRIYAPWGGYVTTFDSRHEALAQQCAAEAACLTDRDDILVLRLKYAELRDIAENGPLATRSEAEAAAFREQYVAYYRKGYERRRAQRASEGV